MTTLPACPPARSELASRPGAYPSLVDYTRGAPLLLRGALPRVRVYALLAADPSR